VLTTTASRLRHDPALARSTVAALVAGYRFTLSHPARSAAELESLVSGLDPSLVRAELSVLLPAFRSADGGVGELDRVTLERWAGWETRFGIVSRRPDVQTTFDPRLVAAASGRG
jgi:ABC-type nitrate/sulfonate/bicarbonate transport system substrate-binding protein